MEERVILNDGGVVITATRAVFGSTTYAIRNLTSVRSSAKKDPAVAALVALAIGALAVFANPFFGVPILAIGAWALWKRKTTYSVVLATSGGETSALDSQDADEVQRVVAALNEAIASPDR